MAGQLWTLGKSTWLKDTFLRRGGGGALCIMMCVLRVPCCKYTVRLQFLKATSQFLAITSVSVSNHKMFFFKTNFTPLIRLIGIPCFHSSFHASNPKTTWSIAIFFKDHGQHDLFSRAVVPRCSKECQRTVSSRDAKDFNYLLYNYYFRYNPLGVNIWREVIIHTVLFN